MIQSEAFNPSAHISTVNDDLALRPDADFSADPFGSDPVFALPGQINFGNALYADTNSFPYHQGLNDSNSFAAQENQSWSSFNLGVGVGFDDSQAQFPPTEDLQHQFIDSGLTDLEQVGMFGMPALAPLGMTDQTGPFFQGYIPQAFPMNHPAHAMPAQVAAPNSALPPPTAPVAQTQAPGHLAVPGRMSCTQPNCPVTFSRDTDRVRHEAGVHGISRPLHL